MCEDLAIVCAERTQAEPSLGAFFTHLMEEVGVKIKVISGAVHRRSAVISGNIDGCFMSGDVLLHV